MIPVDGDTDPEPKLKAQRRILEPCPHELCLKKGLVVDAGGGGDGVPRFVHHGDVRCAALSYATPLSPKYLNKLELDQTFWLVAVLGVRAYPRPVIVAPVFLDLVFVP